MIIQELFKTDTTTLKIPLCLSSLSPLYTFFLFMQRTASQDCLICRKLGKQECGYHQFKNQCLRKMNQHQHNEHHTQANQSYLHGSSSFVQPPPDNNPLLQAPTYRSQIILQNQHSYSHQLNGQPPPHLPRRQNIQSRSVPMPPPQIPNPQFQNLPPPPQNHIMRVQGDQVLYYPIYPVYEVVYEPVSPQNSSILSHSQIYQ